MFYILSLNAKVACQLEKNNTLYQESLQLAPSTLTVALALKKFGKPSLVFSFVGGKTGAFIQESLNQAGVNTDCIQIQDFNRIEVQINKECYPVVGPKLKTLDKEALLLRLEELSEQDYILWGQEAGCTYQEEDIQRLYQSIQKQNAHLIYVCPDLQSLPTSFTKIALLSFTHLKEEQVQTVWTYPTLEDKAVFAYTETALYYRSGQKVYRYAFPATLESLTEEQKWFGLAALSFALLQKKEEKVAFAFACATVYSTNLSATFPNEGVIQTYATEIQQQIEVNEKCSY